MKSIYRYFLDCEFNEGFHKPLLGRKRHFIDLISIGLCDLSGRQYYAVCKEFDLRRAWNKYEVVPDKQNLSQVNKRVYWLRDNVLRKIFEEFYKPNLINLHHNPEFTYRNMKRVIRAVGKSRKQIADDLRWFVYGPGVMAGEGLDGVDADVRWWLGETDLRFYAHYADYDWVVFCSLFGSMMDLPSGFPMYCGDIQQILVNKSIVKSELKAYREPRIREHHALEDALWDAKVFREIQFTPSFSRKLDL